MAASGYFRALVLSLAAWLSLYLLFTWTVDPYGVSPIRVGVHGINDIKPKRLDIDRLIKPYEVWRYQPRTIFLGTSRAHQSLDPSVLDGTRFAPAYNASTWRAGGRHFKSSRADIYTVRPNATPKGRLIVLPATSRPPRGRSR